MAPLRIVWFFIKKNLFLYFLYMIFLVMLLTTLIYRGEWSRLYNYLNGNYYSQAHTLILLKNKTMGDLFWKNVEAIGIVSSVKEVDAELVRSKMLGFLNKHNTLYTQALFENTYQLFQINFIKNTDGTLIQKFNFRLKDIIGEDNILIKYVKEKKQDYWLNQINISYLLISIFILFICISASVLIFKIKKYKNIIDISSRIKSFNIGLWFFGLCIPMIFSLSFAFKYNVEKFNLLLIFVSVLLTLLFIMLYDKILKPLLLLALIYFSIGDTLISHSYAHGLNAEEIFFKKRIKEIQWVLEHREKELKSKISKVQKYFDKMLLEEFINSNDMQSLVDKQLKDDLFKINLNEIRKLTKLNISEIEEKKKLIQVFRSKRNEHKERKLSLSFPIKEYSKRKKVGSGFYFLISGKKDLYAPSASKVVHFGHLYKYGKILILQHKSGYRTILTGDFKLIDEFKSKYNEGELIGRIKASKLKVLYMEVRNIAKESINILKIDKNKFNVGYINA